MANSDIPPPFTEEELDSRLAIIIKQNKSEIFINEPRPSENPSYTAMAGLPGAGKSTLIEQISDNLINEGAVLIDTDMMRDYVPGYLERANDPEKSHTAGDFSHQQAGQLAQRLAEYAFENRFNIIQDGTLANLERSDAKFAQATQEGYEISVQAIAVHPDVSINAVYERYANRIENNESARLIPDAAIENMKTEIPDTLGVLSDKYDIKTIGIHHRPDENQQFSLYKEIKDNQENPSQVYKAAQHESGANINYSDMLESWNRIEKVITEAKVDESVLTNVAEKKANIAEKAEQQKDKNNFLSEVANKLKEEHGLNKEQVEKAVNSLSKAIDKSGLPAVKKTFDKKEKSNQKVQDNEIER